MSCLLWVKISRVENNNKAIGAAVAQVMRFPCGNQAGTLRVAIIAVQAACQRLASENQPEIRRALSMRWQNRRIMFAQMYLTEHV
jgi:hypothetical protein